MEAEDVVLLAASDDEFMELEHLLQEPQSEEDLNKEMKFSSFSELERLAAGDLKHTIEFSAEEKFSCVSKFCSLEQQLEYGIVDKMLEGVNEEANFFTENTLSCFYPDFLLENFQVECDAENKRFIRKAESLGTQNTAVGSTSEISELSNVCSFICEASSDQSTGGIGNMGSNRLLDTFDRSFGWDMIAKDNVIHKGHNCFELENFFATGDSFNPFQCPLTSANGHEDDMIWLPNNFIDSVPTLLNSVSDSSRNSVSDSSVYVVGRATEISPLSDEDDKKSNITKAGKNEDGHSNFEVEESKDTLVHKPLERYIHKTEVSSRRCERLKISNVARDGFYAVADDKSYSTEIKKRNWFFSKQDAWPIHRSRNLRRHRGHQSKVTSYLQENEDINKEEFLSRTKAKVTRASKPQDYVANDWVGGNEKDRCDIRRKHHRVWTLPEVMKLIDGVSQYGVGKWTEIKRLLFSTSAFRTSVDLKDKWRNLLRASAVELHNRKQIELHKRHVTVQIPQSVFRRIRELSNMHPYPSDRKVKTDRSKDFLSPRVA